MNSSIPLADNDSLFFIPKIANNNTETSHQPIPPANNSLSSTSETIDPTIETSSQQNTPSF